MNQFDLKKIEEKAAAAKKKNEPDEDGWVTVSSKVSRFFFMKWDLRIQKGTFSNQDRSIVVEGVAKMSKEEALAKHKQQILNDFYRFQSRQSKKDSKCCLHYDLLILSRHYCVEKEVWSW